MQKLLKLEQLGLTALFGYLLLQQLQFNWLVLLLVILLPDIGMVGYLFNTRIGSITYNLTHHLAVASVITLLGLLGSFPTILIIGLVMLTHSSMDRMFEYGLKYSDSFKHTHLGRIGAS